MKRLNQRGRAIGLLLLAAFLAAIGYLAGLAASDQHPAAAGSDPGGSVSQSADVKTIGDWSADGGHVYALAWRSDTELWFALSLGDRTTLNRYIRDTGVTTSWDVPVPVLPSVETFLTIDRGGLVWLGENYGLVAFDPAAGRFVRADRLDMRYPGADPGALDAGDPLPGTWINGLGLAADGTVLMTRNHVPALFGPSTTGISVLAPLPRSPRGLTDSSVGATPFLEEGDLRRPLIGSGSATGRLSAAVDSCSLEGDPVAGMVTVSNGKATRVLTGVHLHPADRATAGGGRIAAALSAEGSVVVVSCDQLDIRTFSLGSSMEYPDGGAPGGPDRIRMVHQPESIALSPSGWVAFGIHVNQLAIAR